MRNSFATKLLSIAVMLLTPAAMLMAETGNTVLYASGTVTLNGKEVARSASVATGDKIETAGATATALSRDGSKVTVSPYSAVRYQSDAVSVVKGTAAINTSEGLSAQAAQITVTPKDKAATYEIARLNNNVVITSHTGALMITEAGATTELAEGASSSRAAEPASSAAPAPAPAPQAAPVFPGSTFTRAQAWTIAAVVGGAAIACGLSCGMSAASQEPANGRSAVPQQGRAVRFAVQAARVAAVPVVNGMTNAAVINAQARATGAVFAGSAATRSAGQARSAISRGVVGAAR
jgi:hypothetical protein